MAPRSSEQFNVWALRFSLSTAFVVVLLSWINGVRMLDLIIRAGVSFGILFLLTTGSLSLFEKTAFPEPQTSQSGSVLERGGLIDISVGEDGLQEPQVQDSRFSGQVDRDLSAGLPDSERQAEIVRRMGWGAEAEQE